MNSNVIDLIKAVTLYLKNLIFKKKKNGVDLVIK